MEGEEEKKNKEKQNKKSTICMPNYTMMNMHHEDIIPSSSNSFTNLPSSTTSNNPSIFDMIGSYFDYNNNNININEHQHQQKGFMDIKLEEDHHHQYYSSLIGVPSLLDWFHDHHSTQTLVGPLPPQPPLEHHQPQLPSPASEVVNNPVSPNSSNDINNSSESRLVNSSAKEEDEEEDDDNGEGGGGGEQKKDKDTQKTKKL